MQFRKVLQRFCTASSTWSSVAQAVKVLCIDGFTGEAHLQDLHLAAAIENPIRQESLNHQPESAESDAGDDGKGTDDSCPNDGPINHSANSRLRYLEVRLVPGDFSGGAHQIENSV